MFEIGVVKDSQLAREIVAKLEQKNISARIVEVYRGGEKLYAIGVTERESVEQATEVFRVFLGHPPKREPPKEWLALKSVPHGPLTKVFLGSSVGIYILLALNPNSVLFQWLLISPKKIGFFDEVISGQWWRLWTPAFLHFSFLHILFNMLWLKDLGRIYEYQRGTLSFFLFFIVCAGLSNISQYIVQGPYFGGMSGVVYGLLGHLWMFKKFHPDSAFSLPKTDIYLMIGWFFLCMTGLIGNIANTAHGLGLGIGMIYGIWQMRESSISHASEVDLIEGPSPFSGFIRGRMGHTALAIFIVFLTFSIEYFKAGGRFFHPILGS